eukprot:3421938-Ditylum_brightwellii.AAC.1
MMLVYLQLDLPFDFYPDASQDQISRVLCKDGKLLGCFSRKMTDTQKNYPMTDKELLGIVEGLWHFDSII